MIALRTTSVAIRRDVSVPCTIDWMTCVAASGSEFAVNGFHVSMGGQRDYRNGSDDDIVVGARVRVEGQVLIDGGIQVHRVWFLRD